MTNLPSETDREPTWTSRYLSLLTARISVQKEYKSRIHRLWIPMAITDERGVPGPIDPEDTVNEFLSIARLVSEPDLARLYTYVLQHGPV